MHFMAVQARLAKREFASDDGRGRRSAGVAACVVLAAVAFAGSVLLL